MIAKLTESKTNLLLLVFAALALAGTILAAAIFGESLWHDFFELLKYEVTGGVARGALNDGLPKAVEAYGNRPAAAQNMPPPLPPIVGERPF
jgi:hypothetical protein